MIFVAGSANLDFVVRASHIPSPGETVLGRDFQTFPGGKGANQAVACARAGGVVTEMLLALGDDPHAGLIETSLRSAAVTLHTLRIADQPTGCAFICVSSDGENAITVAPGANSALRSTHLPSLCRASHLLMQLEIPLATVQAYATQARQQGVKVVLNAAPAQMLPAALLALTDVLVVNEDELASVTRHQGSIAQGMSQLAVPCVVVTLGARGCLARMDGKFFTQPAYPVKAVDTTAAGDTFCGVLAATLSESLEIQEALKLASAAAALACTRPGAQQSIPDYTTVQALVRELPPATTDQHTALRHYGGLAD